MQFFTAIVLQLNGEITDRRRCTKADLEGNQIVRRLTAGFSLMLREKIRHPQDGVVSFTVPLGDSNRFTLEWRQAESSSALALFLIAGRPAFYCILLSGYEPVYDRVALEASQNMLAQLLKSTPVIPGRDLFSVRERPLLVFVPLPPSAEERDRRLVGNWSTCLGLESAQ